MHWYANTYIITWKIYAAIRLISNASHRPIPLHVKEYAHYVCKDFCPVTLIYNLRLQNTCSLWLKEISNLTRWEGIIKEASFQKTPATFLLWLENANVYTFPVQFSLLNFFQACKHTSVTLCESLSNLSLSKHRLRMSTSTYFLLPIETSSTIKRVYETYINI